MNRYSSIIITEDEFKEIIMKRFKINKPIEDINITYHRGTQIEYPCFNRIEFFWKDEV
jgi:hypothetical protein